MKQKILLFYFSVLFFSNSTAQTIFSEDFGQTTTRQISAYMPSGSFAWGSPTGTNNERWIENNHYAVIAPANIRDAWVTGNYWFWTGPQPAGYSGCDACNPATNDHTGNANGAVMVINAGSTLNVFYQRQVTLVPGNSYRLSFFMYLVNSSSTVRFGLRDAVTKAVLGSSTTGFVSTEDNWVQYTYDFTYPAGCAANGAIEAFLSNDLSAFSGNDYYIDDIVLETIAGPATNISCPTSTILPVKLESFNGAANKCIVQLQWKTATETAFNKYELQYSNNGINFKAVEIIAGKGDNSSYTAQHQPDNGTAFYRLKMTDLDGRYEYSKVITLRQQCSQEKITVYPTVLRLGNNLNINTEALNKAATAQLYTVAGKLVHTQNLAAGNNKIVMGHLIPAMYFLKITGTNVTQTHKVLVQ